MTMAENEESLGETSFWPLCPLGTVIVVRATDVSYHLFYCTHSVIKHMYHATRLSVGLQTDPVNRDGYCNMNMNVLTRHASSRTSTRAQELMAQDLYASRVGPPRRRRRREPPLDPCYAECDHNLSLEVDSITGNSIPLTLTCINEARPCIGRMDVVI